MQALWKITQSKIVKNALAFFISMTVFLLLAEGVTRLLKLDHGEMHERYLTHQDRFFFNVPINRKDPHLFWRLKPLVSFGKISTNSKGFRGKEFSEKKKDGIFRIITLGDSCTLGVGVGGEETYPSVLQVLLNRKHRTAIEYEVINAGVAGYTSLQGLRFLTTTLIKYKPDVVTVQFGFNDYLYTGGPSDKEIPETSRAAIYFDETMGKSRFYRFMKKRLELLTNPVTPFPPNRRVEIQDFKENLKEIIAVAKRLGTAVLVLNLPVRFEIPLIVNAIPMPKDTEKGRITEWFRPAVIGNKSYYVQSEFDGPTLVLEKAVAEYPFWSLAHYFLARRYESTGETEKADKEYQEALETDIDRQVISKYNTVISEIAAETDTPMVDLVSIFASRQGEDLFLDERHLSASANAIIAEEVYNALKTINLIEYYGKL